MVRGNIIFSEKAATDVRLIKQWYNRLEDSLGEYFMSSLEETLARVVKNPTAHKYIKRNVRRCRTGKFPYYVYFSHNNDNIIDILRVRHVKQLPLKRFT